MDDPVTPEELRFSSLKFEKIPVIVVLTREEEMRQKIRNDFFALPGGVVTDEMVEEAMNKRIAEKRKEINGLVEWSYVPTGTCKYPPCSRSLIIRSLICRLFYSKGIGQESSLSHVPES